MRDAQEFFTETCPICKGRMAKGNKYDRLACWKEDNE